MAEKIIPVPEKLLNGEGVKEVWNTTTDLLKQVTGDVDVKQKGTLQAQIDKINTDVKLDNVVFFDETTESPTPPYKSEIDDTKTASDSTWSSEKIQEELGDSITVDGTTITKDEDGVISVSKEITDKVNKIDDVENKVNDLGKIAYQNKGFIIPASFVDYDSNTKSLTISTL